MSKRWIGFAILVAATAMLPAAAQHGGAHPGIPPGHGGDDFIGTLLFPPEMILGNQARLGLSEQQITDIKKLLSETHTAVIDRQVDLTAAAERLRNVLQNHPVDEEQALAAAEDVVTLEHGIKRIHLSLLIRLKNLLTEEQVAELKRMRPPERPSGP